AEALRLAAKWPTKNPPSRGRSARGKNAGTRIRGGTTYRPALFRSPAASSLPAPIFKRSHVASARDELATGMPGKSARRSELLSCGNGFGCDFGPVDQACDKGTISASPEEKNTPPAPLTRLKPRLRLEWSL